MEVSKILGGTEPLSLDALGRMCWIYLTSYNTGDLVEHLSKLVPTLRMPLLQQVWEYIEEAGDDPDYFAKMQPWPTDAALADRIVGPQGYYRTSTHWNDLDYPRMNPFLTPALLKKLIPNTDQEEKWRYFFHNELTESGAPIEILLTSRGGLKGQTVDYTLAFLKEAIAAQVGYQTLGNTDFSWSERMLKGFKWDVKTWNLWLAYLGEKFEQGEDFSGFEGGWIAETFLGGNHFLLNPYSVHDMWDVIWELGETGNRYEFWSSLKFDQLGEQASGLMFNLGSHLYDDWDLDDFGDKCSPLEYLRGVPINRYLPEQLLQVEFRWGSPSISDNPPELEWSSDQSPLGLKLPFGSESHRRALYFLISSVRLREAEFENILQTIMDAPAKGVFENSASRIDHSNLCESLLSNRWLTSEQRTRVNEVVQKIYLGLLTTAGQAALVRMLRHYDFCCSPLFPPDHFKGWQSWKAIADIPEPVRVSLGISEQSLSSGREYSGLIFDVYPSIQDRSSVVKQRINSLNPYLTHDAYAAVLTVFQLMIAEDTATRFYSDAQNHQHLFKSLLFEWRTFSPLETLYESPSDTYLGIFNWLSLPVSVQETLSSEYTPRQSLSDYSLSSLTTSSVITGDFTTDSLKYSTLQSASETENYMAPAIDITYPAQTTRIEVERMFHGQQFDEEVFRSTPDSPYWSTSFDHALGHAVFGPDMEGNAEAVRCTYCEGWGYYFTEENDDLGTDCKYCQQGWVLTNRQTDEVIPHAPPEVFELVFSPEVDLAFMQDGENDVGVAYIIQEQTDAGVRLLKSEVLLRRLQEWEAAQTIPPVVLDDTAAGFVSDDSVIWSRVAEAIQQLQAE